MARIEDTSRLSTKFRWGPRWGWWAGSWSRLVPWDICQAGKTWAQVFPVSWGTGDIVLEPLKKGNWKGVSPLHKSGTPQGYVINVTVNEKWMYHSSTPEAPQDCPTRTLVLSRGEKISPQRIHKLVPALPSVCRLTTHSLGGLKNLKAGI